MASWHALLRMLALALSVRLLPAAAAASRRAAAVLCPAGDCPSTSSCRSQFGTPVCVCPSGQRFVNGACSSRSLQQSDWLDWHNNARAAVGSFPIVWDTSLAVAAQDTVRRISATRDCPVNDFIERGLNLAGGPQDIGESDPSRAVLEWVEEGALYSYSIFDERVGGCSTGSFWDCIRYTQLVWNASTRVGCAVARCRSGAESSRVWACRYRPAGNVLGQFPYRENLCAPVDCPSGAFCDDSSGEAECRCPDGQVLVGSRCVRDRCRDVSCRGDLECDPGTGQCLCPGNTVPSVPGSSTCVAQQCAGVACPGSSSCLVGNKQTPYCACRPGQYLQGRCSSAPSDPLLLTNVALFSPSSGTPPLVIRFASFGECVNLNGFDYARYKIVWRAPASTGSPPVGVTTKACNIVQFWEGKSCSIAALGWLQISGDLSMTAKGRFANALSLKCK